MNLNQRIAGYGRKLSKTERLLVDEMLARYPQSLLESATALARAVGTSASTVVRLLAKLGYDSAGADRGARGSHRPAGLTGERATPWAPTATVRAPACTTRCCMTSIICRRLSPRWIRQCSRPRCVR